MKHYLSNVERNAILSGLSENQKNFLFEELKRSKKTAFANVLAKKKAKETYSNNELIEQIQSWHLVEFIDGGEVTSDLKCECGRKLRYQYIVENHKTKAIRKFGINHLEEHTGIPADIAKEIIKGLSEVDYEMDELLVKIDEGWTLEKNGIKFPTGLEIPRDITTHLDLALPLFDNQISKVLDMISEFESAHSTTSLPISNKDNGNIANGINKKKGVIQANLKPLEHEYDSNKLSEELQQIIISIIETSTGEISSREICEFLIASKTINSERLRSGKPMMFPYVSMFLDFLTTKGKCILLKKDLDDRVYLTQ